MNRLAAHHKLVLALGAATAAVAAALSAQQLWPDRPPGSSDAVGGPTTAGFAPIESYYGGRVNPDFPFAALYGSEEAAWYATIARYYHGVVEPDYDFASLYAAGPAWFEPIARAYDHTVGPTFDWASLYGGALR